MASFTDAIVQRPVAFGHMRMSFGTYVSAGGATGGDIDTGLRKCHALFLTSKGSSVVADDATVNEDLPYDGSVVTIVTSANASGYWFAVGY